MAKTLTSDNAPNKPTGANLPPNPPAPQGPPTPPPDPPKVRDCGTMIVHEQLLRSDPAYMAARMASENNAFAFANNMMSSARTGVTVIPVVVHVVFNSPANNISDAQVQSQIAILNQDYRKNNSDVSKTPAVFQSLCGDARVEFQLATQDPGGNPTNGITRTSTTTASFTQDNRVKAAATGGADAWPAANYLNIWVCQLGSGLLGYAQFPGGPAATDGVVILHSGFGNTGTAAAPFNLGRTATHEIGHWLNLRHIWGDDGGACSGDDFVADTPNCGDHNFGKPAFPHVTCMNGPNGDLFMNYMDYTDDDAMFMFTNGQIVRMQACLDVDRSTIGHTRSGPTMFLADHGPFTAITVDLVTAGASDHPTISVNDFGTVAFVDHPTIASVDFATLAANDHPTIASLDHSPTVSSIDFATIAVVDQHPTIAIADHPPTIASIDFATIAASDHPTISFIDHGGQTLGSQDVAGPGGPGPIGDPQPFQGVFAASSAAAAGRHVPFVLSTPHHTMAWQQSFPDMAQNQIQQLVQQITQYEQLLTQYMQLDQAGKLSAVDATRAEQITQEYMALVAEYRQLTGA